jgi:hypothetical protein
LQIPVVSIAELEASGARREAIAHLLTDGAREVSAFTVLAEGRRLIVYNPAHSDGRISSSLSHELSHVILKHEPTQALAVGRCRRWNDAQEAEADYLAGALLVPRDAAVKIARDLFQKSEAARRNSLTKGKGLADAEAAAVFEALTDRARREDDLGHEESAFMRLCDWTEVRPELFNQFVTFLPMLALGTIPISVIPKLEAMSGDVADRRAQVKALLDTWARGSTGPLKNAAAARLRKH